MIEESERTTKSSNNKWTHFYILLQYAIDIDTTDWPWIYTLNGNLLLTSCQELRLTSSEPVCVMGFVNQIRCSTDKILGKTTVSDFSNNAPLCTPSCKIHVFIWWNPSKSHFKSGSPFRDLWWILTKEIKMFIVVI